MTYTFGRCRSTKDGDLDKFLVIDCEGTIVENVKTLKEAEVLADEMECSFVIKILRMCGPDADPDDLILISPYQEEQIREDFDEELE